ncbi:MAG: Abi family protein [Atopobiaceae bacterium]|nr:Abi family protein [Atopobiaceae bacterium]
MHKQFNTIDEQVAILQRRGVATGDDTPSILLREGYYAVVNGYGKAFVDASASARAGDDRFAPGTTFDQIYQLFLFDRELRAVTFRAVMCVEATLRSVLSHTFCEHHRSANAYLRRNCYAQAGEYLRGAGAHDGDLTWMINTLEHHARGHVVDEHDDEQRDSNRVAWYREHYSEVPLWVLFSDLTFGNLRYFFALMRRAEQKRVCERMREVCGTTHAGQTLTPKGMLHDLDALSALRNGCAHEERVYDATFGSDELTYPQVLKVLEAYLAEGDEQRLGNAVRELTRRYGAKSPAIAAALRQAGLVADAS